MPADTSPETSPHATGTALTRRSALRGTVVAGIGLPLLAACGGDSGADASGSPTTPGTAGAGGGSFVARLRSTTDGSRLHITGSFRGLTVHPASPECAGVPKEPVDTEPDPEEEAEETTG